ncbi:MULTISPECIES: copper resistance protein CopC [unclassified Streptomyces]|uniref:copper resistance CopC family protein n=1 Tax=unclassified Streptomyces TaxID=2593676 RepID=UPI00380D82C2
MNAFPRRAARSAARGLLLPAAALTLPATAPPAAAHTGLDARSPASGATLAGPPPSVTLTFTDAMTQRYARVAVTGPDGTSAATGDPAVRGRTVTLPLDPAAPAGRYTVGYRVVSADGHPVAGSYTFTVTAAPDHRPTPSATAPHPAAPATRPAAPSPGASTAPSAAPRSDRPTTLLVGGALLLAVAAVAAFAARRKRAGHGG